MKQDKKRKDGWFIFILLCVSVSLWFNRLSQCRMLRFRHGYMSMLNVLQSANGGREIDKTATVNPTDEAAGYEAEVDRYIAGMELMQKRMAEDQQEIENLQAETRAMLADLLKAA